MKSVNRGQVLMNKLGNNGIKTICILTIGGMADAFHLDVISIGKPAIKASTASV